MRAEDNARAVVRAGQYAQEPMIPKWFGPDHTASPCPGPRDWLVRFGLDSLRLHQLLRRSTAQRDLSHHGGIDTSRSHCEPHRRLRCSVRRLDQILLISLEHTLAT